MRRTTILPRPQVHIIARINHGPIQVFIEQNTESDIWYRVLIVESITSETAFSYPREVVFDYACDPNHWGQNYKGSGGMHKEVKVPVEFVRMTMPEGSLFAIGPKENTALLRCDL